MDCWDDGRCYAACAEDGHLDANDARGDWCECDQTAHVFLNNVGKAHVEADAFSARSSYNGQSS